MKTIVMTKPAYEKAYGEIGHRVSSEETLAMWAKLEKLSVGEVLILEPEKGEKFEKLRGTWQVRLNKLAFRMHRNFVVRGALNKEEGRALLWKEAKAVAPVDGAGDRAAKSAAAKPPFTGATARA